MKIRKMPATAIFALFIAAVVIGQPSFGATGSTVNHSLFGDLLKKYVHNGNVNYAGFKSEEAELNQYLDLLAKVDPETLSRNEQFAFYANAYNAWTIKLILTKYPNIKSIKELGFLGTGPWKQKVVRLRGELVSLDHIEHDILRPRFKDPRVHFAINCAAKSCPPLRSEPYRGDILDQQLDTATRSFLNNPQNYRLDGNVFYVSRIFDWFSEDFNDDVIGFYLKYATGDLAKKLDPGRSKIRIAYLDYDWSLNGK
jgi:hypothetical protein